MLWSRPRRREDPPAPLRPHPRPDRVLAPCLGGCNPRRSERGPGHQGGAARPGTTRPGPGVSSSWRSVPCAGTGYCCRLAGLLTLVERIDGGVVDTLRLRSPGPADLGVVDLGALAQAEVQRLRRLRQITARSMHLTHHDLLADVQGDQGADGVAVAAGSAGRIAF